MAVIARDKLYEQVWSRPMTHVAAGYGVTSTALKKACNRHHIPTPERGYWAKLEHGKRVQQQPLPKLADTRLDQVRIDGGVAKRLPETVRQAKREAQKRLVEAAAQHPSSSAETRTAAGKSSVEPAALVATRRAFSKARANEQGFVSVKGVGIVPLCIAPSSIDRALNILSQLLALAEHQRFRAHASDAGLPLVINEEPVTFTVEEQSQRTLHEPTTAELKRQADHQSWGLSGPPWPKYDYSPSKRLAIVVQENLYSGLRRTYADGKTQTLEDLLPAVLAGSVEHAAFLKERRRANEEHERQSKEAETRRMREEAFKAREKRRMQFTEAIHEQLAQRSKLSAVLAYLESTPRDEASNVAAMLSWLRRCILQIDALISPLFLDLSARSAKLDFDESCSDSKPENASRYYSGGVELQFWSIDKEKGLATSRTALQWATEVGRDEDRARIDTTS